jgi:sulfite reductase alpha subunit-like flavoprotein
MTERTNEAEIAAVTEVARAYYDGMIAGDEALLTRAFHSRACVVGNEEGKLSWQNLEEFILECKENAALNGAGQWRVDHLSFEGDTALVTLGGDYAGVWYSDDLSMLKVDGRWFIVHKTFYAHPAR